MLRIPEFFPLGPQSCRSIRREWCPPPFFCFYVAVINIMIKAFLGGKCLFHLTGYSLSWREAKAANQDRSLKQKPQRNAAHWFAWHPLITSFLKEPRTTFMRMVPPTVGWATSVQSEIKKIPNWRANRPCSWRQFFSLSTLFLSVTTKISHHWYVGSSSDLRKLQSVLSLAWWALPVSHVCSESWCHQSYLFEVICFVTFYITAQFHANP